MHQHPGMRMQISYAPLDLADKSLHAHIRTYRATRSEGNPTDLAMTDPIARRRKFEIEIGRLL